MDFLQEANQREQFPLIERLLSEYQDQMVVSVY